MTVSSGRWPLTAALSFTLSVVGCTSELPPQGQVLLYVSTNAPLPSLDGAERGMFDKLQIEIFAAGEDTPCVGCSRVFSADRETFLSGSASVGVVPSPGQAGVRARVRLYRDLGIMSGLARPGSTLEATVLLPRVFDDGVIEATVHLPIESLGTPQGAQDAPVEPKLGQPDDVATWRGADPIPCPAELTVPDDMACVPGGGFWMGDPRVDLSVAAEWDGDLERIVLLSPFLLDKAEVTVRDFRSSGVAIPTQFGGPSENPHEAGGEIEDCSYTTMPGPNDDLPVNCVSWSLAKVYCESLGKALPTEAQLEFVQTALGERPFPWGEQLPGCADSVYGRSHECKSLGQWIAPAGSALLDRLIIDDGAGRNVEIVDLAGNVGEWAEDRWSRQAEECWSVGLLRDPLCTVGGAFDPAGRSYRGGNYLSERALLRGAVRSRIFDENRAVAPQIGIRCAKASVGGQ